MGSQVTEKPDILWTDSGNASAKHDPLPNKVLSILRTYLKVTSPSVAYMSANRARCKVKTIQTQPQQSDGLLCTGTVERKTPF